MKCKLLTVTKFFHRQFTDLVAFIFMNWAASNLENRKELQKSCLRCEIFIDPSEQEQGSYTRHLLIGQSRLLSLHGAKGGLGAGQVTCAEQASTHLLT